MCFATVTFNSYILYLVQRFALSDLLDKPWWSRVPCLLPPRYLPSFLSCIRLQHFHDSAIFIEFCQLTLSSRFPILSWHGTFEYFLHCRCITVYTSICTYFLASSLVCWLAYVPPSRSVRLALHGQTNLAAFAVCTCTYSLASACLRSNSVFIAFGIAWPNKPYCLCAVYLCLVDCHHRARLSTRRRHERWLCLMYMGRKISLM